ncbi:hypothetical protein B0H12DRAFT_1107618 [Mycena haematopus]|nr:hypothetical protein B0H12DRAFT_1107618 [Mycena haematopus]
MNVFNENLSQALHPASFYLISSLSFIQLVVPFDYKSRPSPSMPGPVLSELVCYHDGFPHQT